MVFIRPKDLPRVTSVTAGDALVLDGATARSIAPEGLPVSTATQAAINDLRHFVYNDSPVNLKNFRKSLAKTRAGLANTKVACLGDSTTQGAGSGTGGTNLVNGSRARAYPARLTSILNKMLDVPVSGDTSFGTGATSSAIDLVDPRWVSGSSWTFGSTTLGGGALLNSTTTSTLSFTPTGSFDRMDIWYFVSAGFGQFTVNVDGGATLLTIDTAGTNNYTKTTISCAAGTHTINIARNGTGGNVFIAGITTYNSSQSCVQVSNMGIYGSTTSTWIGSGISWNPLSALGIFAPDLSIIKLTANDQQQAVAAATAQANIQTLITKAQLSGDVILVIPSMSTAWSSLATQQAYAQMIYSLGIANSCIVVDMAARWVDYTTANGLGWMFDTVHPSNGGYPDEAACYAKVLALV